MNSNRILPAGRLRSSERFAQRLLPLIILFCAANFVASCSSKAIRPRSVIPADALIYLETRDLGDAIGAITEGKAFAEVSAKKPDLSGLRNLEVSVAVTGFETSERQVTEENSVLTFQPRFVAVAETNAWSWQVRSFVEDKLGEFINDIYGGGATLDKYPKHGGEFYVWTSQDGRKAYALVQGSAVYFGNDESAIEKCLAVARGESDSIASNPKITDGEQLAFGYVSPDGTAQLSNVAGVTLALNAGEESEVKSFIARVLPEILRNAVTEFAWTAAKADGGIEDRLTIITQPEIGVVFNETMVPGAPWNRELAAFVPAEFVSATRYNLKEPQIAWRSILLTTQKQTDAISGELIAAFSNSLFEPYGVDNGEVFLSAVGQHLLTVKFDSQGDQVAVISTVKDAEKIKAAAAKEINLSKPPVTNGDAQIWTSDAGDVSFALVGEFVVAGEAQSVLKCIEAKMSGANFTGGPHFDRFAASDAAAFTIAADNQLAAAVASVLGEPKSENSAGKIFYSTETRFNKNGIERRTVSDFGIIGSIIEQFGQD